jgi:hypothetical protein
MPAPISLPATDQTAPVYCRRCTHQRPLGIIAPGRYWARLNKRTVLVTGGTVKLWCERCGAEHDLDLRNDGAMPSVAAA